MSAAPKSSSLLSILPTTDPQAGSREQGRAGKTEQKGESKQSKALKSAQSCKILSPSWRKKSSEAVTSSESYASLLVSQVSCILSFSFGFLSLFPHLFLFQEPLPGPCLKGGRRGEVRGREAHTKANFQKGKINPACLWTRWSPGAGAQGRSGCLREGEEQAMRRAETEEFHQLQPPPLLLSSPPLHFLPSSPEPFPHSLPPLSPHWLASLCLQRDRRNKFPWECFPRPLLSLSRRPCRDLRAGEALGLHSGPVCLGRGASR